MIFLHAASNLNVGTRCQVYAMPAIRLVRIGSRDIGSIAIVSCESLIVMQSTELSIACYFGPQFITRCFESESGTSQNQSWAANNRDVNKLSEILIFRHAHFIFSFSRLICYFINWSFLLAQRSLYSSSVLFFSSFFPLIDARHDILFLIRKI